MVTGMCNRLDLFVLRCVLLSVESQTGQILPPQNVSLQWIGGIYPQLSWAPPPGFSEENCTYAGYNGADSCDALSPPWSESKMMDGGTWQMRVQTVCNSLHSEMVDINITYPELVRDLQCYIQSSKRSHCSWLPASDAPEHRFFYRLVSEDGTEDPKDNSSSSYFRECSSYKKNGNRTGCDLQANIGHAILILFNGTLNNTVVRNTFRKVFKDDVRPPPLNWTVSKDGDAFIIRWSPPDIINLIQWKFTINYTVCDERKNITIHGKTSSMLPLKKRCPYNMTIMAEANKIKTPWSDIKHFEADTGPNVLVYAAFIIPSMFAGLAVLTFVCCRKNKENIFPKVPQPRDLLSDISDNNNKSAVDNLYVPAEEDDCKITLVIDPQINKLYS